MARVEIDVATRLTGVDDIHKAATNLKEFVDKVQELGKAATSVDGVKNAISSLTKDASQLKQVSGVFGQVINDFKKLSKEEQQLGKISKETADALKAVGYSFNNIDDVTKSFNDVNSALYIVRQSLDNTKQKAKEFKDALKFDDVINSFSDLSSKLSTSFGGLSRVSSDIIGMATAFLSVRGAMDLVGQGYKTLQRDQEALGKIAVVYDKASAEQLEGELQHIKDISNEMGVAYDGSIRGFAQLGVAMKKAGESSDSIQNAFSNMTKIAAGLQLSGEATQRLYAAVTQGFNKTKIQNEELVQQFGEIVPGAASIAKQALASVFPDMQAALKKGQIDAKYWGVILDEVVRNLAKAIQAAQNSLRGQINRIKNAWDDLLKYVMTSESFSVSMNQALNDVFNFLKSPQALTLLKELFDVISSVVNVALSLAKTFANLAELLNNVIPGGLSTVILGFITLTTVLTSLLGVAGIVGVARALKNLKNVSVAFLVQEFSTLKTTIAGPAGVTSAVSLFTVALRTATIAAKMLMRALVIGIFIEVAQYVWELTNGFESLRNSLGDISFAPLTSAIDTILSGLTHVVYFVDTVAYSLAVLFTELPATWLAYADTLYTGVKLLIANIKLEFAKTGWEGVFERLLYAVKYVLIQIEYAFKSSIPTIGNIGVEIGLTFANGFISKLQLVIDAWNKFQKAIGGTTIDIDVRSELEKRLKSNNDNAIRYENEKNAELLKLEKDHQERLAKIEEANYIGIRKEEIDKQTEIAKAAAAEFKTAYTAMNIGLSSITDKITTKFNENIEKAKNNAVTLSNIIDSVKTRAEGFPAETLGGGSSDGVGKLDDRLKALKKDLVDVINGFNQLAQANAKAGRDSTLADRLEEVRAKYAQLIEQAARLRDTMSEADLNQIYEKLDNKLKAQIDQIRSTGVSLGQALYQGIIEGVRQQEETVITELRTKVQNELDRFGERLNQSIARRSGSEVARVTAEYERQANELAKQQELINQLIASDLERYGIIQATTLLLLQQLQANKANLEAFIAEELELAKIKDAVKEIVDNLNRLQDIKGIIEDLSDAAIITYEHTQKLYETLIPKMKQGLVEAVGQLNSLAHEIDWSDPEHVAEFKKLTAAIKATKEALLEARYAAGEFSAAIEKSLPKAFDAFADSLMSFFEAVGKGEEELRNFKDALKTALKMFAVEILREMLAQRLMIAKQIFMGWMNNLFGEFKFDSEGITNSILGGIRGAGSAVSNFGSSVSKSISKGVSSGISSGMSGIPGGMASMVALGGGWSDEFSSNTTRDFTNSLMKAFVSTDAKNSIAALANSFGKEITYELDAILNGPAMEEMGLELSRITSKYGSKAIHSMLDDIANNNPLSRNNEEIAAEINSIFGIGWDLFDDVSFFGFGKLTNDLGKYLNKIKNQVFGVSTQAIKDYIAGDLDKIGIAAGDALETGMSGADWRILRDEVAKAWHAGVDDFNKVLSIGGVPYMPTAMTPIELISTAHLTRTAKFEITNPETIGMSVGEKIAFYMEKLPGMLGANELPLVGESYKSREDYFKYFYGYDPTSKIAAMGLRGGVVDSGESIDVVKGLQNQFNLMRKEGIELGDALANLRNGFDVTGNNILQVEQHVQRWGTYVKDVGFQSQLAGNEMDMAAIKISAAGVDAEGAGVSFLTAGNGISTSGAQAQVAGTSFITAGTEMTTAGAQAQVAGANFITAGTEMSIAGAQAQVAGANFMTAGTEMNAAGTEAQVAGTKALAGSLDIGTASKDLGSSLSGVSSEFNSLGMFATDAGSALNLSSEAFKDFISYGRDTRGMSSSERSAEIERTFKNPWWFQGTGSERSARIEAELNAMKGIETTTSTGGFESFINGIGNGINNLGKSLGGLFTSTNSAAASVDYANSSYNLATTSMNSSGTAAMQTAVATGNLGSETLYAAGGVDTLASSVGTLGVAAEESSSGIMSTIGDMFSFIGDAIGGVFDMFKSLFSNIFGGGLANSISGALFHTGGIVGAIANRRRNVSPFAFVGAPRYHAGGFAGIRPDEYPAILQRNEEILAANDPRNSLNSSGRRAANDSMNVEIINQIDAKEVLSNALNNATGRRILVNAIQAERSRLSAILG
jgi:hypothetical protein